MKNHAGFANADYCCIRELEAVGIPVLSRKEPTTGEVKQTIIGMLDIPFKFKWDNGHVELGLGSVKFTRACYYWVAEGKIPLEPAQRMYENPEMKRSVRANGDCGCPSPDADAYFVRTDKLGEPYVDCYHIDTQEGLDLFVSIINRWKADAWAVDNYKREQDKK